MWVNAGAAGVEEDAGGTGGVRGGLRGNSLNDEPEN
jgi:hypothetical protein